MSRSTESLRAAALRGQRSAATLRPSNENLRGAVIRSQLSNATIGNSYMYADEADQPPIPPIPHEYVPASLARPAPSLETLKEQRESWSSSYPKDHEDKLDKEDDIIDPAADDIVDNNRVDLEKAEARMEDQKRRSAALPPLPQPVQPPPMKDLADPNDPDLVGWNGTSDPENPVNFSMKKKIAITAGASFCTFTVTFASSVFSAGTLATADEFHVSSEVMTLGTSLFVLGFALGPMVWGPLSEIYGRRMPLFLGFTIFAIFQIPVGVATNVETIMLCRYFGGFFGSSPLAVVGGLLADVWDPVERGVAICFYAGATFLGPVLAPIIGSFLTMSYLGWRWTAWITLIIAALVGVCAWIAIPETFGGRVLQDRAARLRFETQNWALHSKADMQRLDMSSIMERYMMRPFAMSVREPILIAMTIYMALIYGIMYLYFEAYPIAFGEVRGWNPGVASLPFLSILIGVIIGGGVIIYMTKTRYARKFIANGYRPVPEERLPPMIIGGVIFPAGMFWFAWTSSPNISWVPQAIAGVAIGMGVLMVFMQGLNYIIDCYMMQANSAIAANTWLRSLAGAGFPLFAVPMYHNLGVAWASSLLAFLAVACFPFPILFYFYGERIRKMSKFAPT